MQATYNLVVLFITSLLSLHCNAEDGKDLSVIVIAEYDPPSSFIFEPPSYRAASALTLSCEVEGAEDSLGLIYQWTSTCSGNCFTQGEDTRTVSTPYLHSYDTGVHSCMVYDALGCTGNANITVNVVGAGVYVQTGDRVLPNNSFVTTNPQNTIPRIHCLSGSSKSSIGNLIGPQGTDITFSSSDPFNVIRGSSRDPGTMLVFSRRPLELEDTGIYTYRTPDESGHIVEFHFGVYLSSYASAPYCPTIEYTLADNIHTLSCVSYGTPPTQVIWERDGERIYFNTTSYNMYHSDQILLNKTSSAYNNTLTINATIEDVIGEYSCTVMNSVGNSPTLTRNIEALEVRGHETPILVGLDRIINCSTHLEVTRMEWLLRDVGNSAVEEREDGGQNLELPLIPDNVGLNGAEFTCRVTTAQGKTFSKTITIKVRELTHVVSISGAANPLPAGGKFSLTCTVTSELPSTVTWLGPSNREVDGADISARTGHPVTVGNTTTLFLHFDPVKTSHGGTYACQSSINGLNSEKTATRHVEVQITSTSVSVTRQPSTARVYTADVLRITCVTAVNQAVNTPMLVAHQWRGPSGVVSSGSGVSAGYQYSSVVTFTSLRSSHSGNYTCSSTISPVPSSVFIASSAVQNASTSFNAAIRVTIEITYDSPDDNPDYSPPNYRTASAVTLRCVATGATGITTYRWSSTCSSCFASSASTSTYSSSYSISDNFLLVRDAGVHTCTVTDSVRSSGSNATTMNIVGVGIYVSSSLGTHVSSSSTGSQPSNSFAIVDTGGSNINIRFQMYCCSNSTSPQGSFTYPTRGVSSNSYWHAVVSRHYGSDSYAGCYQFYYSYYYYYSFSLSSYSGIYTCSISDSRGNNLDVNIGLYDELFSTGPSIRELSSTASGHSVTLVCRTQHSPPTIIKWYRDNTLLDIHGNSTNMSVSVTNRRNSYFDITLTICDSPANIAGRYRCEVGNRLGSDNEYYTVQGLQVSCSQNDFSIGRTVSCSCSSDIATTSIRWYQGNSSLLSSGTRIIGPISIPVTTDNQGDTYTCAISTACGDHEESITVNITVPDAWASVEVSNSTGQNALHNTDYVLTCTVTAIPGMNLAPSVEWVGPDGSVVVSEGNRTVGEVETQGSLFTLTLSFSPVVHTDGGRYVCRATISVPWMTNQPPPISAPVDMPVTSQVMFQLKILQPLTIYSSLDVEKALGLERSIKRAVERGVREHCDCPFSSTAIYSGRFSCQSSCSDCAHVTYRAILNGTSDLLPADQLMEHLQDWREARGTLLYNVFSLRLASSSECQLSIDSFEEEECTSQAEDVENVSDDSDGVWKKGTPLIG